MDIFRQLEENAKSFKENWEKFQKEWSLFLAEWKKFEASWPYVPFTSSGSSENPDCTSGVIHKTPPEYLDSLAHRKDTP